MITAPQIKALHVAKSRAHLDDAAYRTMLRTLAKVESSKDPTFGQEEFEDCMAFLEDQGGGTDAYWRTRVLNRGRLADPRVVHKINALFAQYEQAAIFAGKPEAARYKLAGLVRDRSGNRTLAAAGLTPGEAHRLIEQLKAIVDRTLDAAGAELTTTPRLSEMKDSDA